MKTIVCKLNILVEINNSNVTASSSDPDHTTEQAVNSMNNVFTSTIQNIGFNSFMSNPRHISKVNGGYAMYNTFMLKEDIVQFKLILDVRVADHPSKPNLSSRNASRSDALLSTYPDMPISNILLFDTYCKQHDWGLQIFIGDDKSYSHPITSLNNATSILESKLLKAVKSRFNIVADNILSSYSIEAIELAQDYIDETDDSDSYVLIGDELVDDSLDQDIARTRLLYLDTGAELGLFDNHRQFDEICNALRLKQKYS